MGRLFSVRCTKTVDNRFELNKIYDIVSRGSKIELEGDVSGYLHFYFDGSNEEIYNRWYNECMWRDYDFEFIEENKYVVELL